MSPAGRAREAGTPRATRGASPAPPIPADIWVLVGAAFIVAIGYGIVAPVLPQFAESFGLGVTASSIVVSAFAFFRLVSAPAGGRFVNRFGERPVYVIGLLIVAASTFAVALSQSYWQLLLFRGLGGLGSTMFTVSAMALIVRMSPPRARARSTGLYATSFLLGNIAGPVLGGFMAGLGMRVPFVIYAVGLVIAAAVVRLKLGSAGARPVAASGTGDGAAPTAAAPPAAEAHAGTAPASPAAGGQGAAAERAGEEAPAVGAAGSTRASAAEPDRASAAGPEPGDPGGARAAEQAGASTPMRFREAWRESGYRAALFGGMANGWASMGIRVAVYPLFALHVLGVGAAEAGWALTVFALGNAVAVTSVGRFADIYGRKPFIVTGFAVLGLATIVLGYWESLTVFLVLSAVAGVGAGLLNPAQQAAVADVIGSERAGGKVLSRFQMAMDTGAIFGPIIAGWLADAFGYSIAFAASGALALLAGLFWLTARETLPPAEAPESD
ncbi:MFS transporter [Brevibacterium sp. BRM-1]|nr:MFS transporter [Brevibacterium sp. BRM-1]WAL39117.1 MFS transporter [Brevibacterium sp. BRM-1]